MGRFLGRIHYHKSGCWEWTGTLSAGRYGSFKVNGKQVKAHRWIYEQMRGPIQEGMVVCHSCDNAKCVNPNHLWIGTQNDNIQDCINKGRAYHPKGFKKTKGILYGDMNPSRTHPESRPRGENVNTSKINEDDVRTIRLLYSTKQLNQVQLSAKYSISQPNISAIILRKTWAHID
jgi:hypothetical protein